MCVLFTLEKKTLYRKVHEWIRRNMCFYVNE
jgi:hypothetical protein